MKLVLSKLVKYFYNGSIQFHLDPNEIQELCVSTQDDLLNLTINSKLIQKYPVSHEFIRLFLKKILSYLEPNNEVTEGIFVSLCNLMSSGQETDKFTYRHYIIHNDATNIITIKETKNMVINGTTGMKTWEAALILADWILRNKDVFEKKRILELGSGVGLTGITIAKFCDITSITLTDCHDEVIKTINENIQINFPTSTQDRNGNFIIEDNGCKTIRASMLDWNSYDYIGENEVIPDVIIGADIVYDPSILQSLVNVLKIFFKINEKLDVYIACIIRNEDTMKTFFSALESNNMLFEEITMDTNKYLEWDRSINKYLLKINLNK